VDASLSFSRQQCQQIPAVTGKLSHILHIPFIAISYTGSRSSWQSQADHPCAGGILVQESLPGAIPRQEAARAAPVFRILGGLTTISPHGQGKDLQ
jgi:hypothetical protein